MYMRCEVDGPEFVERLRAMHDRLVKNRARMEWLDEQPPEFRAMVHEIGLNAACRQAGVRPPV